MVISGPPSEHAQEVWWALLERVRRRDLLSVTYGDLSKKIFGNPNSGLAVRNGLQAIYDRIKAYNRRHKDEHIPFLCAVVVGAAGDSFSGEVLDESQRKKILSMGLVRWKQIGREMGFSRRGGSGKSGLDPGASVSSNRERHSVDPRHAPIVFALKVELERLGWEVAFVEQSIRPDLVVTNRNKKILFEVKPDDTPASFHCAIGQLLVYREAIDADRVVIVASGRPVPSRRWLEIGWRSLRVAEPN